MQEDLCVSVSLPPSSRQAISRFFPSLIGMVFLLSWLVTVAGKYHAYSRMKSSLPGTGLGVVLPDCMFFAAAATVLWLGLAVCPCRLLARLYVLLILLIAGWSLANVAWLMATGIQLQPSVPLILVKDPGEFWPIVQNHLMKRMSYGLPIILGLLAATATAGYRLWRPNLVMRRGCLFRAGVAGLAWAGSAIGCHVYSANPAFETAVLAFSSHWHVLKWCVRSGQRQPIADSSHPLARGSQYAAPLPPGQSRPNIVLVFLESLPYARTSMADPATDATPWLAQFASQGVEFTNTRCSVAHTRKAMWAALTATYPDLGQDHVEAVLSEKTYAGLPSILKAAGYRSAFFCMAKGSFECGPGFCRNLGFDWAWCRENLGDPSAYLGYLGGDDCRMLAPMQEWISASREPFLMVTVTTAAHDPYEVPAEFAAPATDPVERYLQAVRYDDHFLKQLCEMLERLGLSQKTILCVLGDHGTTFRACGSDSRWVPYEEVIRVPWVIRWPGHLEPKRVTWPCSQLDVLPTLLGLLNMCPVDAPLAGRDALQPCQESRRLWFSSWYADGPQGYIESACKVVWWPRTNMAVEYDLRSDPGEESPTMVAGPARQAIAEEVIRWREQWRFEFPPSRVAEALLYDHWRTFCSGRLAWSYYVP